MLTQIRSRLSVRGNGLVRDSGHQNLILFYLFRTLVDRGSSDTNAQMFSFVGDMDLGVAEHL